MPPKQGSPGEPGRASAGHSHARVAVTILLVEDNADIRNYLSRLLGLRGHTVLTASSMDQALQVASEADFELLISDIDLPDGSGLELMWKLHGRRAVPGIALSGFGSPADVELSRSAGFVEHLTKPVDFHQLESAIDRAAARGRLERLVPSGQRDVADDGEPMEYGAVNGKAPAPHSRSRHPT
jgi:DNA-binding NtrC family response regulator